MMNYLLEIIDYDLEIIHRQDHVVVLGFIWYKIKYKLITDEEAIDPHLSRIRRNGGTAAKFGIGSTIVPILNITRQRS